MPCLDQPCLHQQRTVIADVHDKSMCAAFELSADCLLRGLLCCCTASYAASLIFMDLSSVGSIHEESLLHQSF